MKLVNLVGVMLLAAPHLALSGYDPEKIKNTISADSKLFPLSGWELQADGTTWEAKTTARWLEVTIGTQETEIVSPYINFKQMNVAKSRCVAVAATTLGIDSEEEKNEVAQLIESSKQHHRLRTKEKNNVRFEVTPKLVGAFVKLFCSFKPAN